MTQDVEHLFICLFVICMSSIMRGVFGYFAHLLIAFLKIIVELLEFFVYFGYRSFIRNMLCKYILPVYVFFFYSLKSMLEQKILILMKSDLSIISFMDCAFDVASKELLPNSRSPRYSSVLSCQSLIVSCFTFRSMIHLELIIVIYKVCI